MSEKPIIFGSEMVKAILEGRKTQVRRVIKPQPPDDTFENDIPLIGYFTLSNGEQVGYGFCDVEEKDYKCPFGKPSDTLWVREKFLLHYPEDHSVLYFDDMEKAGFEQSEWRWKPSIHMPRWASRINLLIKDVRVERLQDISEEDAYAEGGFTVGQFIELWDSINAKCGYSWDENPWVWAIEFEVVK